MDVRFSAEPDLLVRSAIPDRDGRKDIGEIAERVGDWEKFLQHVRRHQVGPLVARSLGDHYPEIVPDTTQTKLREERRRTATRNLQFASELSTVVDVLEEEGIDAIPYRGPVLANDAYGDVGLRQFGDLDFLVRRDDITEIRVLLEKLGYQPRYLRPETEDLTAGQEWAYTHFRRDYAFDRDDTATEVELHWRVVDRKFPTSIDLDYVWERRETTTIGGRTVPVLSPEDRLLMLCVHGSSHCWDRLRWIVDVHAFLRAESVNWEVALERARSQNAERMFLLGPAVARRLYDTELPETVVRRIRADPGLEQLCETVVQRLFGADPWNQLELHRFYSRTLGRNRDRARLWAMWVFNPTRRGIERLAFPQTLAFMYVPLRLVRLLLIAASNAFSSLDWTPDSERTDRSVADERRE